MNKEDYVLKIANATPVQLVSITNRLMVEFVSEAIHALEAGNNEVFEQNINRAKSALEQLMGSLNFEVEIAQELYDLYLYAGKLLNRSFFDYDAAPIQEVKEMFETLLEGWEAIEDTPDKRVSDGDTVEDGPQVYAGLTYEKGGLSEYIVEDENHGFKA